MYRVRLSGKARIRTWQHRTSHRKQPLRLVGAHGERQLLQERPSIMSAVRSITSTFQVAPCGLPALQCYPPLPGSSGAAQNEETGSWQTESGLESSVPP